MQNRSPVRAAALAAAVNVGALAAALIPLAPHATAQVTPAPHPTAKVPATPHAAAGEHACTAGAPSRRTAEEHAPADSRGNGEPCEEIPAPVQTDSAAAGVAPPGGGTPSSTLETMIVRAARLPLPAAQLGSSVTVLDGNLLERRQGALLGELLRSAPGIAVSRTGGIGALTQLRVRGGESNHVLVFVDGVRANDPAQNSEFNIAHLPAAGIESVEFIRGPQSSLWGSDALSGVISVTTRRAEAGGNAEAVAEGGSEGWRRVGGSAGYGNDRLSVRFDAADIETDGHNASRSGDERDGYENTTLSLGFGYAFADGFRADANVRFTDSVTEFDGVDFGTGLPTDRDNVTDARQIYGRLGAELDTFNGRWKHRLGYALTDTGNGNVTENAFAPTGYDLHTTDARVDVFSYQTSFAIAHGHVVTGACERQEEAFSQRGPVGFGDPNRDEEMNSNAFIFQYSARVTPAFALLASARNDRNSDFRNRTTGRLSAAWQVADGAAKLRAAYGTGFKNPTFTERYGYFTSFTGNPDLRPEHSRGWEIGIDGGRPGGTVNASLTWFDEKLKDEINGFVFDPATFAFTAGNEDGRSRRRGLELNGHWLPAPRLRLGFAYTWLDADEENAAGAFDREVRRPKHVASANLDWGLPGGRANLNLNLDYNGAQDDFYFPPVPPFRERVELDGFALLSVAGSYRLAEGLTVFARVENALGENYEEVFGFNTPGRAVYAGLRYRIGN